MAEQQINLDTNKLTTKGRVVRWQLLSEPPEIESLATLRQDDQKLLIVLRPVRFENLYVKVGFENALSFRSTQEGLCFNSVDPIDRELWGTTFFIVADSAFIRQFHENSSWTFEDWNITHYAIYTSNVCVDVLSVEEPVVSWEQNQFLESDSTFNE